MQKKVFSILSIVMLLSMVLAACAPAVATSTQQPAANTATQAPAATEAPTAAPTEAPTAAPTTRHGGWLDEIDVSVVAGDSAISQVQAGAIDFFSFNLASDKLASIKQANLGH